MRFKNRVEAAELLARQLEKYRGANGVVLALPRGGVPLGYIIAAHLHLPLDIILIKKIGYPGHEELAVGAVSLQSRVLNPNMNLEQAYFDRETQRIREQLRQRYQLFRKGKEPLDVKGMTVLLVDDGIATGYTIKAAAQLLQSEEAGRIVIAAPVAPPSAEEELREWADDVVVLSTPTHFQAVGQFYDDFSETTDEEVIELLKEAEG